MDTIKVSINGIEYVLYYYIGEILDLNSVLIGWEDWDIDKDVPFVDWNGDYEETHKCNPKYDPKLGFVELDLPDSIEYEVINMTDTGGNNKLNIYGVEYKECMKKANEFENNGGGQYYKDILCLKTVGQTCPAKTTTLDKHYDKIKPYISNSYEEVKNHLGKKLCVLPKGHSGKCSCTIELFKSNPTTGKIKQKIDQSIYKTPGDNDHVFKNRDSRIHPIAITNSQEQQIRNSWSSVKEKQLKCCIPLKEKSTPFMIASAYIDYFVCGFNIHDIDEHIDKESIHYKMCSDMLKSNKEYLIDYFGKKGRKIFDNSGHTICAVLGTTFNIVDLADPSRDNRRNIKDTDIQMGHIDSRCGNCFTIRGKNIVMMSRRGNLMIGENSFIDNTFNEEIISICKHHALNTISEEKMLYLKNILNSSQLDEFMNL